MRLQHPTLRNRTLFVLMIVSHICSLCLSFRGSSSLSSSLFRHVSIPRQSSDIKQRAFLLSARYQSQVSKLQLLSSKDGQPSPEQRSKYVPPEVSEAREKANEPPYVKIADIVRYYDLDGGRKTGQELVGKITYVSEKLGAAQDGIKEWNVEVAELEDVGNGYFAEPSSRKSKRVVLNLKSLAPVIASFVRSEDAFKVPTSLNDETGKAELRVSHEGYKIEGYEGPMTNLVLNQQVLDDDMARYDKLKNDLFRDAAIAGLVGAVIAQATRGTEDAICYALGAAAGVGYIFLLSLKTDTVGSPDSKFGSGLSKIRFLLPFFILLGISARNIATGVDDEVLAQGRIFSTVKIDQFADVAFGFLTYRIPLFLRQLQPLFSDAPEMALPGSAGVVMGMMKSEDKGIASISDASDVKQELKPVLLICGPDGTGKTSLVNRLIADSEGKFVRPKLVDRIVEGVRYEILESKGGVLREIDHRYSLTAEGILNSADTSKGQAVVIDADTDLAEKLKGVAGARIIGVWVGLDSLDKLKDRFRAQIQAKAVKVPSGETEDVFIRGKIRKVVKDIEFGVVSGIFEFTILNDDFEQSVAELKDAAQYCFK